MQSLNADNKKNIIIFVNKIKGKEYLVKKIQAVDIKKERVTKR